MMEIKTKTKVIRYIEYDDIKFYPDKKGYWLSSRIKGIDRPIRLHIYVWTKFNGEIPEGYHIHHKDHNRDNNDISNLELMSQEEHLSLHGALLNKENLRKNMIENLQPKATEWHKSEASAEWHKKHYQETKDKLHQKKIIKCMNCGTEKEIAYNGHNKFCSNNCKSAYRRKSGVDNITTKCEDCNMEFTFNKYNKKPKKCKLCASFANLKKARSAKGEN